MELTKKRDIFFIRLLVIIIISYLTIFGPIKDKRIIWPYIFIAFYLSTNLFLPYIPDRFFISRKVFRALVFFDSGMVSLGIYLSGHASTDFYLVYFLILGLAAMSVSLKYLMINATVFTFLYGWILYQKNLLEGDLCATYALRLPFIIIIAFFFGYIVETIIKDRDKSLRESEEKYRQLFTTESDAIVIFDEETALVKDINDAALNLYGYDRKEFLQLKATDILADPGKAAHDEKEIIDGNTLNIQLQYHKKKDGTLFPAEVSSGAFVFQNLRMISTIIRDISERVQAEEELEKHRHHLEDLVKERTSQSASAVTKLKQEIEQRKQAQEALRESDEKIKKYSKNLEHMVEERTRELNRALYDTEEARDRIDGILKSVANGLIVTDIYNRIILMNRAAEDLLNVRFSEVIDRPIDFAIQDKTLRDRIKNTLEKKKTDYQFDFELPGENAKHPRIMRARTSGIKDKTGTHTGIITIIHNVTLEREVDRMKTEFICTAAHELRTPLTSIRGFSEILLNRDDINKKERNKFLAYINDQSVNLAHIINDLLDISRIESGLGFSLNKAPCDMADIIRDLVPRFEAPNSGHHFEVILPEDSMELEADKEKMEQVLQNLLSNAVKYSPEGGTICLSAKKISDSAIEISVADQGIGMTHEQVEKIFDKFYRADPSDRTIEGTGLGMNIVKYLVEAHEGKVWVESQYGVGTMVSFTLQ